MKLQISQIPANQADFPAALLRLPKPPQQLFIAGQLKRLNRLLDGPCLAIVGSRAISGYGRQVTEQLATGCARAGITVVSGLAIGVDSVAHQAALEAGGQTIAVLPSSLERIYPTSHQHLAEEIVKRGGVLVSEYQPGTSPMKHQFIARNRLIAGLSQAVLVTEAAHNSGSLHTAQFSLDQGQQVLAVPANITSANSVGCNRLIQTGAKPVLEMQDILEVFEMTAPAKVVPVGGNAAEQTILDLLGRGISDGNALLVGSLLDVPQYHQTMTMLEIKGHIKALGGNSWRLKYG